MQLPSTSEPVQGKSAIEALKAVLKEYVSKCGETHQHIPMVTGQTQIVPAF